MPRAYLVRVNSRGLHHDAKLLAEPLMAMGYDVMNLVHPFQWDKVGISWSAKVVPTPARGDLIIFLENMCLLRDLVKTEARVILIPNLELLSDTHVQWAGAMCDDVWHKSAFSKKVYDALLAPMEKIPAVPRHAPLGFTSRDMYNPLVKKEWKTKFLHMFGTSPAKGSQELLRIWKKHPEWPHLVMVGTSMGNLTEKPAENITWVAHVPEDHMSEFLNQHAIHVCPSAAEGWGHYIVEPMSCGNVVLTTDAPPMNEHITDGVNGFLLPLRESLPYRDYARVAIRDDRGNNMARWNIISEEGLEQVIRRVLAMSEEDLVAVGKRAREWFLRNHAQFLVNVHRLISAEPAPTSD